MKKASITEAKNKLSALIDSLRGGAPVLIVDRGRPVARLEPVMSGFASDPDDRLCTAAGKEGFAVLDMPSQTDESEADRSP